jgi:hypothetical protein
MRRSWPWGSRPDSCGYWWALGETLVTVAISGIISLLGLIVPHLARLVVNRIIRD